MKDVLQANSLVIFLIFYFTFLLVRTDGVIIKIL
jgi:hypothetical protein